MGTGSRVSYCDARVPTASRGEKFWGTVSLRHSLLGQEVSGARSCGAGCHWGNIPGAVGQWGRRFWGRK